MLTIILPGYSLRNKEWAESIANNLKLKTKNSTALVHNWNHWTGGSMSVKDEVEKILGEVGSNKLNILAKSVGTMVCMFVLQEISVKIRKIILCGIPSVSAERLKLFKKALANFPTENIICYQNENDPLANYEEVKKFMSRVNPKIKVIKMDRSDHHYPYPVDFANSLFLKQLAPLRN